MFDNLKRDLVTRKCPECSELGSLSILESQGIVKCNKCFKQHLDPWAIGPWETAALDTHEGKVVSSYKFELSPSEEKLELNENFAELIKRMNSGAAARKIEPPKEEVAKQEE